MLKWLMMEKIFQDKKIALAILVGLSLLVYLNSLNGAFVSDDIGMTRDPLIGSPLKILLGSRNLGSFTKSINYLIGGFHPFIYHLTNLLFHFGVVVLVYFFLLQITSQEISFLATAIFAVHPIHTEAISWISGRPYVLGAVFLLASLWFYIAAHKQERLNYYLYLASLVCFFAAQFAEIKSIAFLLIIGLYELTFGKLSQNWKRLIPYFVLTLFFLGLLFNPFKTRVATENPEYAGGVTLFKPWEQIPIALSSYLELFVWPMNLTLYHEDMTFSTVNYLVRLAITVILFCSLIYFYRKQKLLFFGFSFFILSLVPTLLPIHIAWIVAERYVYLGSIGLCLVAAWVLVKGLKKYPQGLLAISGILILLLSVRTIVRNRDWRTRETLWVATAKVSPGSPKAWNNMGDIYAGKEEFQLAIMAFQRAIELRPNYVDAHHNTGVTYLQMKEFDKAIEWFEKAIAIHPLPQSYHDMGVAYFYKGELDKAEENFKKILEFDPNSSMAYNSLGLLYFKQGMVEEARQAWQTALQFAPNHEGIKRNLILLEQSLQASPSASPQ